MAEKKTATAVVSSELVSRLEKTVQYYERMHADARRGIEIAMALSAEMKERRIEAQLQLERAKSANDQAHAPRI
jgi:hypothetical protein